MTRLAALLALGGWLSGAPAAFATAAEQPADEGEYSYALWTGLMSPYCPGRVLIDCPSPQADALRGWIEEQEDAGRSRADVERDLYARFGDIILQTPRASGWGLAAYIFPLVAALAGVAVVVLFLRRQSARASGVPSLAAAPPTSAPLDPDLERRIDEEFETVR